MAKTKVIYRNTGGGFISLLITFLLGFVFAFVAVGGAAYYVVTQITIKQAVTTVLEKTGMDEDYTEYITEEYAEKTLYDLFGNVVVLAEKVSDGTFCLNDLNEISPQVSTQLHAANDLLTQELGITLTIDGEDGLLNTPLSEFGAYFSAALEDVYVADVIEKVAPDVDLTNPLLSAVLYDETNNARSAAGIVEAFTEGDFVDLIDHLSIGEIMGIDTTDPNTDELIKAFADCTVADLINGDLMDGLSDLHLKDLLDIDANSNVIMQKLGDCTIADLTGDGVMDKIKELKLNELIEIDQNSNVIMQKLGDCTIEDLTGDGVMDEIKELKLNELIEIDTNAPQLLQAIGGWSVEDLSDPDKINDLSLREVFGDSTVNSSNLLKILADKNTTLGNLPTVINQITIQELLGDEIYQTDGLGNKTLKGTWKYLLLDSTGNEQRYTISDMTQLVNNMQRNVQSATMFELVADGIIAGISATDLETEITYQGNSMELGELTITQLIQFSVSLLSLLS